MSLILDALSRARAERGEGDGPALAVPAAAAAPPPSRRAVVILSLALVATCVLLVWFAVDRFGAAPSVREDTAATPALPRSTPPAAEEEAVPGKPKAKAAPAESDRVAGSSPVAPEVAALYRDRPDAGAAAGELPGPEGADADGAAATGASRATSAPEAAPEEAIDVAEVLARARRELGEPALAPHPAPLIADLSQQQKDAIPTLMYLRHDYTGDGRSRVQLNGEPRAVGDSVDGVRIEEILPDSVVLRHRATLFRLRALNSWVNL